ncbi:hypothetical protein CcaverHIS631_0401230 [Cutaneotrichosporon cavernicola]|nr:hypothetical protein CcaverHIS631_0401230 [Cutaneotrichosporon cavernicola]
MGPLPLYLAESLDKNPAKKGRAAKVKVKVKAETDYDRALLVTLVAKFSKADYAPLAESVGKTASQCRDVWRKVMFPALVEGREWSAEVSDVWRKVVLPRLMSGKLLN